MITNRTCRLNFSVNSWKFETDKFLCHWKVTESNISKVVQELSDITIGQKVLISTGIESCKTNNYKKPAVASLLCLPVSRACLWRFQFSTLTIWSEEFKIVHTRQDNFNADRSKISLCHFFPPVQALLILTRREYSFWTCIPIFTNFSKRKISPVKCHVKDTVISFELPSLNSSRTHPLR